MKPKILYLYRNDKPRDRVQELILSGILRYVAARGWEAVAWEDARPEFLPDFLKAHHPVVGCVVECSDDNGTLPPRLFEGMPVVYLHAAPSLYGGKGSRVATDNAAVVRLVFRELSAGHPTAYGFVGDYRGFRWSRERGRAFKALAKEAGAPCRVFGGSGEPGVRAARLAEWVAELPRHAAVFAANDFTAAEVVAAARAAARDIPREITLCGVDNLTEVCESATPTITSIQFDFEREGYMAASMLAAAAPHPPREGGDPGGKAVLIGPLLTVRRESTRGSGRRVPHILAAVERIRREACNGLTARDVIAGAPGSKSLFNLRFREAMGHSVHDEIEHVRLEKVFTLLADTDTAVGAIAALCGYRTGIALHKAFRQRTGMSMAEWRKLNRR